MLQTKFQKLTNHTIMPGFHNIH